MSPPTSLAAARAADGASTVRLTDGDTAYRVEGERGPWVVLIHGLITPMYSWEPLSTALASAGFRVLRYDHFGRGLSDRPDVRYDPALYERQLSELLRALAIDSAHVVGWSMGAIIAARLAQAQPERVSRLVLIAPGMFVEPPPVVRLVARLPWLGRAILARSAPSVIRGLPAQHLEHPDRFLEYAARMRTQTEVPGLGASFASTVLHYPWGSGPELAAAGAHPRPVQLIWGNDDPSTPYRNAPRIREVFPRAELVTIAGARHAPHVEHAARVHPPLVEFLRREGGAPRADVVV
jgi:pimeloyl-ACP methyl ester carboxylesterase